MSTQVEKFGQALLAHWQQAYAALPLVARAKRAAQAAQVAWHVHAILSAAQTFAPDVFAASSTSEPARQAKFEHLCAWLAAHWPHVPPALRQPLLEDIIDRLEISLREAGVGDMAVGPQVRRYAAAANGRLQRYLPLLTHPEAALLTTALAEHHLPATLTPALRAYQPNNV